MRKLIVAVVIGCIMGIVSTSLYAFSSQSVVANTASVQFTGAGTAVMTVTLHRIDNNNAATSIFWDPASITLGTTKWAKSGAYIQINSNVTGVGGGIQIYTHNPILGSGTTSYAGLVCDDGKSSLALAYKVTNALTTDIDAVPSVDGAHLGTTGSPTYYTYMWMSNKNDDGTFVNGSMYNLIKQGNQLRSDESTFYNGTGPGYIYFSADFSAATTPHTYETTQLTIESYVQ